MKLKLIAITLSLITASACNEAGPSENDSDSQKYDCIIPPPDSSSVDVSHTPDTSVTCYRYDKGEEHDWIKIIRVKDSAYGDLHYNWEGKDGANGPFTGSFKGDTLWIVFNANMEGHLIHQEHVFLLSADKLLEGQGTSESNEAGDYYYLKHKKLIVFEKQGAMVKGPCM